MEAPLCASPCPPRWGAGRPCGEGVDRLWVEPGGSLPRDIRGLQIRVRGTREAPGLQAPLASREARRSKEQLKLAKKLSKTRAQAAILHTDYNYIQITVSCSGSARGPPGASSLARARFAIRPGVRLGCAVNHACPARGSLDKAS